MFELKPISQGGIEEALARAEHYRLLNEPRDAESICRDILEVAPGHQPAIVMLLLVLTDQFQRTRGPRIRDVQGLLEQLDGEYQQAYYAGLICERWAKAQIEANLPGFVAYDWLTRALGHYERAESSRPTGNDDSILRWNACVRIINARADVAPRSDEGDESLMRDH